MEREQKINQDDLNKLVQLLQEIPVKYAPLYQQIMQHLQTALKPLEPEISEEKLEEISNGQHAEA